MSRLFVSLTLLLCCAFAHAQFAPAVAQFIRQQRARAALELAPLDPADVTPEKDISYTRSAASGAPAWPEEWNATLQVTMSDFVAGSFAETWFSTSRKMQVTRFEQCANAAGPVLYEPCTLVLSSDPSNFGIYTVFDNNTCCLNFDNIGTLPPTWTETMRPCGAVSASSGTTVLGKEAVCWEGGGHRYLATPAGTPLFVGPEEWLWLSFNVGDQTDTPFQNILNISQCKEQCLAPPAVPVI